MKVARREAQAQHAGTRAALEVSIVMPCLNEAETIARCIQKAQRAAEKLGISAEVIVADNGSTDGSAVIARELGARVVEVARKGYGAALIGEIGPFIDRLRKGDDLVVGNRFAGGIEPGAMPWLHRWLGNPVLSRITRTFFHARVGDTHCGLRAFRKDAFERMQLRATGMEFASEMVVKASLKGMRMSEVPVVLHPDGRSRPPHLRTWRDGWRHLRFMLLFSPRWLFLYPGLVLLVIGAGLSALLIAGPLHVFGVRLDIHTLLVAGFLCLLGYQLVLFAVFTKIFAIREGFHPPHPMLLRLFDYITLEVGLGVGAVMALGGVIGLIAAVISWHAVGFGNLDPSLTMREVIPAVVLMALGTQTVFASFFISILSIER
jgi:hypothetical protein